MLVLTGVTTPAALLAAPAQQRPTYVAAGLSGLLDTHPAPRQVGGGGWQVGGFTASAGPGGLRLAGGGGDDLDALRALCACAWADGPPPEAGGISVVTKSPAAEAAARRLALPPAHPC